MLDEYLLMLEEAKKRDHRKIGIPDASVHYRAGTAEEADGRVDENYTGNELRG
jgi:threonyl-tRNA synthetase